MWRRAFVRAEVEGVRVLELARIAVGRPVHHHHRGAGRHVDPADGDSRRASRKSPFTGLSKRSDSSMKFGIRSRSVRSSCCNSGSSASILQRRTQQSDRGLLPSGVEVGRDRARRPSPLASSRRGTSPPPSRVSASARGSRGALRCRRRTSRTGTPAGCAPEPRHRCCRRRPAAVVHLLGELGAVLFGHAEQVGDHGQGERCRESLDVVAAAGREIRIEARVSACRHMNSSFSLRRFGVIRPISRARCSVCFGGSITVT